MTGVYIFTGACMGMLVMIALVAICGALNDIAINIKELTKTLGNLHIDFNGEIKNKEVEE